MRPEPSTDAPAQEAPTEVPLWFGPTERPLFGWIHQPRETQARAAVVVCPALGQEGTFSHYLMRDVAVRLAELGFLVVRFNYDGTGDSAGTGSEPGRVQAWAASTRAAVDLAREHTTAPLVLVGMRLGALVAVDHARGDDEVDGLVLWDPPRSGRALLREQRVRHQVALGDETGADDGVTVLGSTYSPETVRDLSAIDLRGDGVLPARVALSLVRPGRDPLPATATTRGGGRPETVEAPDQDDLLLRQTLPARTTDTVVAWVDRTWTEQHPLKHHLPAPEEQVLRLDHGTERVVRIGPTGLFGLLVEPDEPRTTTTTVFIPDGHTPHTGLSRMWTDHTRGWAEQGLPSLRFDLSGCGDSPAHPGEAGHRMHLPAHLDDVADALRVASPRDPSDVVVAGICAGGYLALETALAHPVRAVVAINPAFANTTAEYPPDPRRQVRMTTRPSIYRTFGRLVGFLGRRFAPRRAEDPTFPWDRWLETCQWKYSLNRRAAGLPELLWSLLNLVLLRNRPERTLRRLGRRGIPLWLVAGDPDWDATTLGAHRRIHRLERSGLLHTEHLPDLDHDVLRAGQKQVVLDRVDRAARTLLLDRA